MKKHIEGVTVYGIDIGKNTFHVVGLDTTGKPILHSKFRRDGMVRSDPTGAHYIQAAAEGDPL
jgi:hypothetical protein